MECFFLCKKYVSRYGIKYWQNLFTLYFNDKTLRIYTFILIIKIYKNEISKNTNGFNYSNKVAQLQTTNVIFKIWCLEFMHMFSRK